MWLTRLHGKISDLCFLSVFSCSTTVEGLRVNILDGVPTLRIPCSITERYKSAICCSLLRYGKTYFPARFWQLQHLGNVDVVFPSETIHLVQAESVWQGHIPMISSHMADMCVAQLSDHQFQLQSNIIIMESYKLGHL